MGGFKLFSRAIPPQDFDGPLNPSECLGVSAGIRVMVFSEGSVPPLDLDAWRPSAAESGRWDLGSLGAGGLEGRQLSLLLMDELPGIGLGPLSGTQRSI